MYVNTNVKLATPVYKNILEAIGNTPLVKLNVIPKEHGLKCEFYAKCEYMNPGGSIKDRLAYSMVRHAEKEQKTKKHTRFVEPTSGNTGIGLAFTTVVKRQNPDTQYKATIVTPDKNSEEKLNTLRLLGAEIVQIHSTDDERAVARDIVKSDPNGIELNQFSNPVNPETHYEITAREILVAMDQKVDMAVMGVGTGGTITGVARYLKQNCHNDVNCIIVAVDPKGSVVWEKPTQPPKPFYVEGIGDDFIPDVLDKKIIDIVVHTEDKESFNMARELCQKEGLLCGGSSGAAMWAAIEAAKHQNLNENHRVVVVLPDGIRNYMTKFVCDQWMEAHMFKNPPTRHIDWWTVPLTEDDWTFLTVEVPIVSTEKSCRDLATNDFSSGHNVAIVVDLQHDVYEGAISKNQLRYSFINPGREKTMNLDDLVSKHMIHDCPKVQRTPHVTMGLISRIMDIAPFVVVLENIDSADDTYKPKGIITTEKVWDWILKKQNKTNNW